MYPRLVKCRHLAGVRQVGLQLHPLVVHPEVVQELPNGLFGWLKGSIQDLRVEGERGRLGGETPAGRIIGRQTGQQSQFRHECADSGPCRSRGCIRTRLTGSCCEDTRLC